MRAIATMDVDGSGTYDFDDLLYTYNKWNTYDPLAEQGLAETGLMLLDSDTGKAQTIVDNVNAITPAP